MSLLKSYITNDIQYDLVVDENNKIDLNNFQNIYAFAHMARDAYTELPKEEWHEVSGRRDDLRKDNTSVRAFLYSNIDKSVNVIAFKGTSLPMTGSTSSNDKYNDNMFFSCCFYKENAGYDCNNISLRSSQKSCNRECYRTSLLDEKNYYNIALTIMKVVSNIIDIEKSDIVFVGHSLGGAIATMIGLRYDKGVVTFESPGEKHYLEMSGQLITNGEYSKIYHYGHNADTIFTGKCWGFSSPCYYAGYNIQTKCHVGNVCEYDAKGLLKIRESIYTHTIDYVIENVMSKWNGSLPTCMQNLNCIDCSNWITQQH
uniref:triacylglycerol lipase n=1 Tax=viral metagenome TaxID=1070528 RepID=A0A6C0E0Q2_9ZZZZ